MVLVKQDRVERESGGVAAILLKNCRVCRHQNTKSVSNIALGVLDLSLPIRRRNLA